MERIQEALEKARRERSLQNPNSVANTGTTTATHMNAAKVIGGAVTGGTVTNGTVAGGTNARFFPLGSKETPKSEDIEYSGTRRVRIDSAQLKARKIVGGMPHDPMSDAYRQLRGQILQKMRSNNWQTLAITSPANANGKTLTAINLAISLSQEVNQTVLLADFNLRSPSVAQTFGIDDLEFGVTDYLDGQVSLEKILINPEYSRLVILPGNKQLNYSAEMLSSPKMRALQQELRNRYVDRIILYDLPPLLVHDDALLFIPQVDATLLVIEDGGATKPQLERCIKLLDKYPIAGTVINKAR